MRTEGRRRKLRTYHVEMYMINDLMRDPPVVLQDVVVLCPRC